MKKIFLFSFLAFLILGSFISFNNSALAKENKVNLYFFYGSTCLHCAAEDKFLNKLEQKYPEIDIKRYDAYAKENQELLLSFCEQCNSERYVGSVPMLFIKPSTAPSEEKPVFILGFDNENGRGKEIEIAVQKALKDAFNDNISDNNKIHLPFLGDIDTSKYSLFALTIVLGFLDGFNVCSLGALVFILGLVLAFRSRRKTLGYGGLFIATTAGVYGGLMLLWYKLFSTLASYLNLMNILVGLIASVGGFYFWKQFVRFRKYGVNCQADQKKWISRMTKRLSDTLDAKQNILIILGSIFVFTVMLTIIEFPCSAAVPLVFTGILSQSSIGVFEYSFYMLLYLIFYMLDEIIVFLVAFFTMKLWLSTPKATLWVTLVEALILSLLGVYYLFGWLI